MAEANTILKAIILQLKFKNIKGEKIKLTAAAKIKTFFSLLPPKKGNLNQEEQSICILKG